MARMMQKQVALPDVPIEDAISIYARFSIEEGDERGSIESQIKHCQIYAEKTWGIRVKEENVFTDEWTGTLTDRPAFNRLKQAIQVGRTRYIVALKVNRIGRKDYIASQFLQESVQRYGAELHIIEGFGRAVLPTKDDLLYYGMLSQFGQFQHLDLLASTTRGRRDKAEAGIHLGQGKPLYGYDRTDGRGLKTELVINPVEAAVIALIYKLYVDQSYGATEIARYLETLPNCPPPSLAKGRDWQLAPWSKTAVLRILRREEYAGVFYQFKQKTKTVQGAAREVVNIPKEQQIRTEHPNLAILDRPLWEKAQEVRASTRDKRNIMQGGGAYYQYLMTERLKCDCGENWVCRGERYRYDPTRKYFFYKCKSRMKSIRTFSDKPCGLPTMKTGMVDTLVWQQVEEFVRNPGMVLEKLRQSQIIELANNKAASGSIDVTLKKIEDYEAELVELRNDWKAKRIPIKRQYEEESDAVVLLLEAARKELEERERLIEGRVITDAEIERITKACESLADYLDRIGELTHEEMLKAIALLDVTGEFNRVELGGELHVCLLLWVRRVELTEEHSRPVWNVERMRGNRAAGFEQLDRGTADRNAIQEELKVRYEDRPDRLLAGVEIAPVDAESVYNRQDPTSYLQIPPLAHSHPLTRFFSRCAVPILIATIDLGPISAFAEHWTQRRARERAEARDNAPETC